MATVRSVERQIKAIEGFAVRIHFSGPARERGRDVRSDRRDLPGYPYTKRRPDATVAVWRKERFERTYPGFTAVVLDSEGAEVNTRSLLSTVRATYA